VVEDDGEGAALAQLDVALHIVRLQHVLETARDGEPGEFF